jgi:hypothetical protein
MVFTMSAFNTVKYAQFIYYFNDETRPLLFLKCIPKDARLLHGTQIDPLVNSAFREMRIF